MSYTVPGAIAQEMRAFAAQENVGPNSPPLPAQAADPTFGGAAKYEFGPTVITRPPLIMSPGAPSNIITTVGALFLQEEARRELPYQEALELTQGLEIDMEELAFSGAMASLIHTRSMRIIIEQKASGQLPILRVTEALVSESPGREEIHLATWNALEPRIPSQPLRSLVTHGLGKCVQEARRGRRYKAERTERLRIDATNAFLAFGWTPDHLIKPDDFDPSELFSA